MLSETPDLSFLPKSKTFPHAYCKLERGVNTLAVGCLALALFEWVRREVCSDGKDDREY